MKAAGRNGIPCSFVVGKDSKLAYIGHPIYLDSVIPKVVDGSWEPKEGMAEVGRVTPYVVPLGAEDEARADRLLRESVCISLHEHCGIAPADWDDNDVAILYGK